jgi:hypothetical protein
MAKILLLDIETTPILGYAWGTYQTDILHIKEDWYILSYAAKWLDQKKITCTSVYDRPAAKEFQPDHYLCCELSNLLDSADVVIAHNGIKFDMRKIKARIIQCGLPVPSPVAVVDTLKEAKATFSFTKNRLDYLGEILTGNRKMDTGGFKLWLDCMDGCPKAFAKMKKYNVQDVKLLEEVYLELRPWMKSHPNLGIIDNKKVASCDKCCSTDLTAWGYYHTNAGRYQRYACNGCGGWVKGAKSLLDPKTKSVGTRAAK